MQEYKITHLRDHTRYYYCDTRDIYDHIYRWTGNHEIAEEMSSWAELAPQGDNWTNEEIEMDLEIVED